MKNKNMYLLLVLLLMSALFITACGGEDTTEPEANTNETAAEPATNEQAAEPTDEPMAEPTDEPMAEPTDEPMAEPEIFLTIWADDTRTPILQALAQDFEASYGVGLVVEQIADINDQFPIAAPAGEGPDILIGPHDRVGGWVASGLVAPIDLGDKASEFYEVALEGFTVDGQLYGIPYAVENMGFFRNTDLVAEAPQTWEEVIEIGSALQESGDVTYGMVLEGNGYKVYPILTSFGGYVFGQDNVGNWNANDLGVDSEGMIAAGDWISEQVAMGFMSDNVDGDTAQTLFETGEVPFIMDGPWALTRYREAGVPYAISPFPSDGQPFSGIQGFMVNALSENVLLAQAFLIEFVATPETMMALQSAGNRPAALIAAAEAAEDPDLAAFGVAGANATNMPAIPEMGGVWGSWNDAIVLIITGEQAAADALSNAAAQIRTVISTDYTGMVNVPGSWQAAAGCAADWDPACEVTFLSEGDDGLYTGSFDIPAGDYEGKVALEGTWTVNYGVDGEQDGPNYAFSLASDGTVTFTYDPETHILEIATE